LDGRRVGLTRRSDGPGFPRSLTVVRRNELRRFTLSTPTIRELTMGRGILLWLLGVPIPVIILLALIWH
jgi:hypothetical protein